ncbi:MAG: 4-hydroxybenzoyl-CoA thioesterase [Treponema sp.]|nr:MAG: 4-hydroxybenzoyl-CoA thioesterase [Treponema sp.]
MAWSTEVEVRTYELDSYNHVNNAVYLNYLEYARMQFLRAINFDYTRLIEDGYMLFVTRADIKYKYSARLYDKLTVEVESIKLKKVSGVFFQRIINQDGIVCAEAEITWACVSKETGRPTKLPEKYGIEGLVPRETKE